MRVTNPFITIILLTGASSSLVAAPSKAEIDKLIRQLRSPATQTQASLALVDIGLPAVEPLIEGVCTTGLKGWSRDTLLRLVLRARDEGGPRLDRAQIAAALVEVLTKDERQPAREAAVHMLGLIGRDEAVPALAGALKDEALCTGAIAALQQVPTRSAATALIGLARSAPPARRCDVIHSLGRRGCPASVGYLTSAVRDKHAFVQIAALRALGQAGAYQTLPVVQEIARHGAEAVRPSALTASLELAEAAADAGKKAQSLGAYQMVMKRARDPLHQIAAIAGYARVAGKAGATRLTDALLHYGEKLDKQIVLELVSMPGKDVTRVIAEACDRARGKKKGMLLAVLGHRRDKTGYPVLIAASKSDDEAIRKASMLAMAVTGEPSLEGIVAKAVKSGTPGVRAVAAEAYTIIAERLLREDGGKHRDEVLETYHAILGKKRTESGTLEDVLKGLAKIASPKSAPIVEGYLTRRDQGVREAAARAYLAIANKLDSEKDKRLGSAMYGKLIDLGIVPSEAMPKVLDRMCEMGAASGLAERLGMITQWHVIGPWPNNNYDAYDKVLPPEKKVELDKPITDGKVKRTWKPVVTKDPQGRVDLRAQFKDNQNKVAYATTEVVSDKDRRVVFRTGSDDGMKVWVNGKPAFGKNGPRALAVDADQFPVKLSKGTNRLLVKVLNGSGAWEFCVRATTEAGRPVELEVRPVKPK